ncbi:uncharacterized protein LOC143444829 isoform X2 [Clavelina lepadiformis]|uniref:uncharacterized protein LOC143444829 isoform X2 n=1 Tax=Clavelina lepadiformis TaxID=159417 RepID=UPI004042BDB6
MRPWQQYVMTRVERVATCFLFIFMVMLTSMMFHGHSYAVDGNVLTFGHYYFKWSHVVVGIESALMCFPGPFLISLLFRHAQRRKGNEKLNPDKNLQSTKPTRGQHKAETSFVRSHDVQTTGTTMKENTRNMSQVNTAEVDQERKNAGQHIPDDKNRPSTSKEVSNFVMKQPPIFAGKFEIINEKTRREKNPRKLRDLSMTKKPTSSRVEQVVPSKSLPAKSVTSSKRTKYIPSRVERNAAALSPPVKSMTSSLKEKSKRLRVEKNVATTSSPVKGMTSSQKKKSKSSRVEENAATSSSPVKGMKSSQKKKSKSSRVARNVAITSSAVKVMTSSQKKKSKSSRVEKNTTITSSPVKAVTSSQKKKSKSSRVEKNATITSSPVKVMTSSQKKKSKSSRVARNVAITSSPVKVMTSSQKKKSKSSRVARNVAITSSPVKVMTSSQKKKSKSSRVERNVAITSSPVKVMTSSQKKKSKSSRVEKSATITSSPVKAMTSSQKKMSKSSRVVKNAATTSSPAKALTSSVVKPSARPPLSAAEAQQEFSILEIDPNTLDPLAIVHFSIYVAWFYIIAVMVTSTVICVLYGMTYGLETCRDWLVSFVSAFIETVVILESLKVVVIAYFSVLNNPRHDLRDWVPPLPPSVRPRSYVNRDAIRRKQKREKPTNPIYRSPTRERTNRKINTQENIEMRLIKQRVSP